MLNTHSLIQTSFQTFGLQEMFFFFLFLAAPQSVLLLRLHHGRMPDSLYGNLSDLCLVRLHCHWAFNWSGPSFYFISKCCQIPCILLIIYLFVQNHYSHTWTGFGLFFLWWSIHIQQMLHFLVIKHSTFIEIHHLIFEVVSLTAFHTSTSLQFRFSHTKHMKKSNWNY